MGMYNALKSENKIPLEGEYNLFWDVVENYIMTYRIPKTPVIGYNDGRTVQYTY
jgi:hypothetical protein